MKANIEKLIEFYWKYNESKISQYIVIQCKISQYIFLVSWHPCCIHTFLPASDDKFTMWPDFLFTIPPSTPPIQFVKPWNSTKIFQQNVFVKNTDAHTAKNAKYDKNFVLLYFNPAPQQKHAMSVKPEELLDELTVNICSLYHHLNFKYLLFECKLDRIT